jgi:two-component system, NtrC family, sensor kinase
VTTGEGVMRGRYERAEGGEEPRRTRVLVVDDDESNVKLLAQYLMHENYVAEMAGDGPTALAIIEQGDIDLVVLDVRMPDMDGLEVCRRLRAMPRFARLPVIFLTADQPDEVKEAASLEAGGDEYLLKPVSRRVLALRVRNLLRLANAEREKQLMAQVAHAEKLAGIGQVAAGVAHEINNPLSFILSNLASLRGYFDQLRSVIEAYRRSPAEGNALDRELQVDTVLGDIHPLLDETLEGGERVRRIVQELKTFSRSEEDVFEPVDLAEVVRSTLLLTERELAANARLVRELAPAKLDRALRPQLHQVVLNLVINAMQATHARVLPTGERHTITLSTRTEGELAVLSVSDTGVGVPEALRTRIFEPFFTTKAVGVGSGLGLAVCALVAQRLGGTIELDSVEGRGSTFTLRLPTAGPTP